MKRLLLTLSIIVSALHTNAQLLWQISGNGLEKSSYIIGTHHLAPISIVDSISGFTTAFRNSEQIIGELKMSELQSTEIAEMMEQMMVSKGDTTLRSLLSIEDYLFINNFTKEYLQFDISTIPTIKGSFIQNNIVVQMFLKKIGGFNPQEQLDEFIQTLGSNQGKKVLGLETPEFQFDLLYNSASLQRQADLLLCLLKNIELEMEQMQLLTNAYMRQDLQELLRLSEQSEGNDCDMTIEEKVAMIDNRNLLWVNTLDDNIKQSPSLIVVGALHLPGENGVLNLLRQKGYSVEPM